MAERINQIVLNLNLSQDIRNQNPDEQEVGYSYPNKAL
jgi:hypothetical protein